MLLLTTYDNTKPTIGCQPLDCDHFLSIRLGGQNKAGIDSLVIHWPSGLIQTINDVRLNQLNTIEEDNGIQALGQVVWTDPPFPTQFDDVTVYFDAKEGNGALQGFNGQVFAHTGLITNQS